MAATDCHRIQGLGSDRRWDGRRGETIMFGGRLSWEVEWCRDTVESHVLHKVGTLAVRYEVPYRRALPSKFKFQFQLRRVRVTKYHDDSGPYESDITSARTLYPLLSAFSSCFSPRFYKYSPGKRAGLDKPRVQCHECQSMPNMECEQLSLHVMLPATVRAGHIKFTYGWPACLVDPRLSIWRRRRQANGGPVIDGNKTTAAAPSSSGRVQLAAVGQDAASSFKARTREDNESNLVTMMAGEL
ncbi:hypothetical protein J3F83DRAFT_43167 [Trichoderma novae-zelandiae]